MKIFNHYSNTKKISLKNNTNSIGNIKLLVSFSKEWKDTVYYYNNNLLKNIPTNNINISKLIKNYFELVIPFKSINYRDFNKLGFLAKKGNILNKIYVSDAEIKHSNNKTKITFFVYNKQKYNVLYKIYKIENILRSNLIKSFNQDYYMTVIFLLKYLKKSQILQTCYITSSFISKKNFTLRKLKFINIFLNLQERILEIKLNKLIKFYYLRTKWIFKTKNQTLDKKDIQFLNQDKFHLFKLLPKLSNILNKLTGKSLEYNIINLKSLAFNPDIFTNILGTLIRKKRRALMNRYLTRLFSKVKLDKSNEKMDRFRIGHGYDNHLIKYNNPLLISNISKTSKLDNFLDNYYKNNKDQNQIHTSIFNSIQYKLLGGIKVELKGGLTARYRADRAISRSKKKGELKNIYSAYQGKHVKLFRGNTPTNIISSTYATKRRIGSYAIKGWLGGK